VRVTDGYKRLAESSPLGDCSLLILVFYDQSLDSMRQLRSSFASKRNHWIKSSRSSGRNQAGRK
jgi:hypothetical protein